MIGRPIQSLDSIRRGTGVPPVSELEQKMYPNADKTVPPPF